MHASLPVAVIGAGLAGLSCAKVLRSAGLDIQVFDKSRGPAGRMSTRRGEGWACDHGAQYFTARDPHFQAEVASWEAAGVAAVWEPRLSVLGGAGGHRFEAGLRRWVGVPAMTAPARWLAASLPVRTLSTVTALRRTDAGAWQLQTAEDGWRDDAYRAILLALPAPQASALVPAHVPALREVCASVRMRGCWALMLQSDTPLSLPFDAAFVNQGPLRWIARNSSKPGRMGAESWLLHAEAEWSEVHLSDAPAQVTASLLEAFAMHGGPPPDSPSISTTLHRWRYADSAPALALGCAWQPDAGLGLCGDWLNAGKVEGAWLSGRALAEAVLQTLR